MAYLRAVSLIALVLLALLALVAADARVDEPARRPRVGGECMCPRIYDPVCGSDHVTYSNTCMFQCAAAARSDLRILKMGPCDGA